MASPSVPWEFYPTFLAVLEEGSLSAAARRLGVSQPTVGRHIEGLEAALGGLSLFTRAPSGLTPTHAALAIEASVRDMALGAEAAQRMASAAAGSAKGVVRITASEVIGAEVLPALLADFRGRHPEIAVELSLSNRTEDLLRREADIAVRMTAPRQEALLVRRIGLVPLGIYAHRRYVARYGLPEDADDIRARPLIGFDRRAPAALERLIAPFKPSRDEFAFRTDSDLAALAALRAGFGLGVCQKPLAARDPDLLPVGEALFRFELGLWLATHENLRAVKRVRLLFDHLVEGLGAYVRGAL